MRWYSEIFPAGAMLVLVCSVVRAAPRVRRSDAARAASYFYFSGTPGHSVQLGTPFELAELTPQLYPLRSADVSVEQQPDGSTEDDEGVGRKFAERYQVIEGTTQEEDHKAQQGHKDEKGYESKHALDKGSKGHYGDEDHGHHYSGGGDRKHSYHDEGSHYHDHHGGAKRTKGGKHSEKKHHRKGSKTTGYHNVYHKDEYKKEHIFYDTSDHTGSYKKYGSAHEHHSKDAGEHGHGGHEDRAEHESKHRNEGHKHGGQYDRQHSEYENRHGQEQQGHTGTRHAKARDHHDGADHGYQIFHN